MEDKEFETGIESGGTEGESLEVGEESVGEKPVGDFESGSDYIARRVREEFEKNKKGDNGSSTGSSAPVSPMPPAPESAPQIPKETEKNGTPDQISEAPSPEETDPLKEGIRRAYEIGGIKEVETALDRIKNELAGFAERKIMESYVSAAAAYKGNPDDKKISEAAAKILNDPAVSRSGLTEAQKKAIGLAMYSTSETPAERIAVPVPGAPSRPAPVNAPKDLLCRPLSEIEAHFRNLKKS